MKLETLGSLTLPQLQAMVLAYCIRGHMEQFHGVPHEYLPEERMPEFNVAIRYALYDFFFEDADSDEPFDDEWVELLVEEVLHSVREFYERYIPKEEQATFYFAIHEAIDTYLEFIEEFPHNLVNRGTRVWLISIPDYWEIPATDPRPDFS